MVAKSVRVIMPALLMLTILSNFRPPVRAATVSITMGLSTRRVVQAAPGVNDAMSFELGMGKYRDPGKY